MESRKRAVLGSASLDFGSISAVETAELTIAVPTAVVGDAVSLGVPVTLDAGLVAMAYVSAADVVTVRIGNITAGAIDPDAGVFSVAVIK